MYIHTDFELSAYLTGIYNSINHPELRVAKIKDPIIHMMDSGEDIFLSNSWLREHPGKRLANWCMFGDIYLNKNKDLKVLDIAGGYSSLTKKLASNCTYTLIEPFMDYKNADWNIQTYIEESIKNTSHEYSVKGWEEFEPQTYDLVTCNDLFPNCNQRIESFLEKYLPVCKEMRLILTVYNYKYIVPELWNGKQLKVVLDKYKDRIKGDKRALTSLPKTDESIYSNNRQVCYVELRGDLYGQT